MAQVSGPPMMYGDISPMLAPMVIGQPAGQPQPLATALRGLIDGDAELRSQLAEARRRNLPRLTVVKLAPEISPASFTQTSLASFGERTSAPQWRGTTDPWFGWLQLNIKRRVCEILAECFDHLRHGRLAATAILPSTGSRTCVPSDVWWSAAVVLATRTGALVAGPVTLFLDVQVEPPAPQPVPAISLSAVERFVTIFAGEMLAAGRRFSSAELLAAAEAEGVGPSANVVTETLRRLKPSAWARRGRRSAAEVPTPIEIAAAARQAGARGGKLPLSI